MIVTVTTITFLNLLLATKTFLEEAFLLLNQVILLEVEVAKSVNCHFQH